MNIPHLYLSAYHVGCDWQRGVCGRVLMSPSPIEIVLEELQASDPAWKVDLGQPQSSGGWINGTAFASAEHGPFRDLLERSAARLNTTDRRTVAALFALRFGWAASVAITPFLMHRCVPNIGLSNISIKFRPNTLYERTAIHHVLLEGSDLASLRKELRQQSEPVVEALYQWSGFAPKGAWGMITTSWAGHFIGVCGRLTQQTDALPIAKEFFNGSDEIARMQPRLEPVSLNGQTRVYQRRASCCRYYLLPQGDLCASCPLVSDEERLQRNLANLGS